MSKILGGRSEVLETPVLEALKYIELVTEEEQELRLDRYMMMWYANPEVDEKNRQQYLESIKPQSIRNKEMAFDTDIDLLKAIKAGQKGGN